MPFSEVKNIKMSPLFGGRPQSTYLSSIFSEAATSVIHRLSQEILNFSMYMLGCKAALEQDLSIGAIFRRKTYWDVPLILSTRLNGMYLSLLVLYVLYL